MALIPDEILDDIRERIDIVALVEEHVRLKKAGVSHKGLCPFHQEKTPSFHVNPVRRSFYCFGCQKKGDAITFLREMKGLTFVEAAHELARRAGVTIPERDMTPEERARVGERRTLLDVNGAAGAYFREMLLGPKGVPARAYLDSRGIGPEVAEAFQLGYALDEWEGLAQRLQQRRLSLPAANTLGLVAQGRKGFYDLFRNRVICPVMQREGEVLGFSGRTLSSEDPRKYYNSPESPLYRKSHLLFGLAQARAAVHKKGRAFLVEGNFDVVALHQAGFTETVAPLGTALTEHQVELLRRHMGHNPTVILCLDADKAGRAAAMRAIPLLAAAGLDGRGIELPDGEDPDTFVRKQGAAALEELLAHARPLLSYFLDHVWYATDRTPEARARALREVAPIIGSVTNDDVKRDILVKDIARGLEVDARTVLQAVSQHAQQAPRAVTQRAPFDRDQAPRAPARTVPPSPAELNIIGILADHPDLFPEAEKIDVRSILTDARLRDMYSAAQQGRDLLESAPMELSDLVAREVLAGKFRDLAKPLETLIDAVQNLRRARIEAEARDLERQVQDARRRGDEALVMTLIQRQLQNRKEAARKRPEEDPR